jgi:hypothetical protein
VKETKQSMKSEQLDTEDWKEISEAMKRKRSEKRCENTELIYDFCFLNQIALEEKTPYHFRLKKQGFKPLDIFPTSGKVHQLRNGKTYYVEMDLQTFLPEYYKAHIDVSKSKNRKRR